MKNFIIRAFKNYFFNSVYILLPKIIALIITLLLLPLILSNLTPYDYGLFQFFISLQLIVVVVSGGEITTGSKNAIAHEKDGTFLYAFLYRQKIMMIIGIVCLFFLIIYYYFFPIIKLLIIGLLFLLYSIFGYLFEVSYIEFLIAKQQFKQYAILLGTQSVIVPFLSTIVAIISKDIIYYSLSYILSLTISSWICWLIILKKYNLIKSFQNKIIDTSCIQYGVALIPVAIIGAISLYGINIFIGLYFGIVQVAIFSVSYKLIEKSRLVFKVINPLFYSKFVKQNEQIIIKKIIENLQNIFIISASFIFILSFFIYFYIRYLIPNIYYMSFYYSLILVIGLFTVPYQSLLYTILESKLNTRKIIKINVFNYSIRLVLMLILGIFASIIGICIAIVISDWLTLYYNYYQTKN